jgi:hypothetical protein
LSTLNDGHRYFKKDYFPSKAELKQSVNGEYEEHKSAYEFSSEEDSFFKDIPYEMSAAKSKNSQRKPFTFRNKENQKYQSEHPNRGSRDKSRESEVQMHQNVKIKRQISKREMLQHHIQESLKDHETIKLFTEYSKQHGQNCSDMNKLYEQFKKLRLEQ